MSSSHGHGHSSRIRNFFKFRTFVLFCAAILIIVIASYINHGLPKPRNHEYKAETHQIENQYRIHANVNEVRGDNQGRMHSVTLTQEPADVVDCANPGKPVPQADARNVSNITWPSATSAVAKLPTVYDVNPIPNGVEIRLKDASINGDELFRQAHEVMRTFGLVVHCGI